MIGVTAIAYNPAKSLLKVSAVQTKGFISPAEHLGQANACRRARLSGCKRGDAQIREILSAKPPNLLRVRLRERMYFKTAEITITGRDALRSYPQWRAMGLPHISFDTKSNDKERL